MEREHLEMFREILLKEKNKILNKATKKRSRNKGMKQVTELFSERTSDLIDIAREVSTLEMGLSLEEYVADHLAEIDEALAKIDRGTYGICEECGKPISLERLEILPTATKCVECKKKAEQQSMKRSSKEVMFFHPEEDAE